MKKIYIGPECCKFWWSTLITMESGWVSYCVTYKSQDNKHVAIVAAELLDLLVDVNEVGVVVVQTTSNAIFVLSNFLNLGRFKICIA